MPVNSHKTANTALLLYEAVPCLLHSVHVTHFHVNYTVCSHPPTCKGLHVVSPMSAQSTKTVAKHNGRCA